MINTRAPDGANKAKHYYKLLQYKNTYLGPSNGSENVWRDREGLEFIADKCWDALYNSQRRLNAT